MTTASQTDDTAPRPHDRTYFILFHVLAWFVYAVAYYEEVLRYQKPPDYWQVVAVATTSGSVLCWGLALANTRTRNSSLAVKVVVAAMMSLFTAIVWTSIRGMFFGYVYAPSEPMGPLLTAGSVFRATNTLLFWNALYLAYDNYKIAQHNQISSLTAQSLARENQLKLLSYQLNPHFLFNVLNSISALVLKRDSHAAHATIVKLSEFLRYTLYSEPWRKVPLHQELKCIEQYLEIQKVRFEERLHISYDAPKNLSSAMVPNLILQPIVENAIKHTVAASAKAVEISICGSVDGHLLRVDIANSINHDSIEPCGEDSGNGIGLANVRERLEAYYGDDSRLETSHSADRYLVTLLLPYQESAGGE